MIIKNDCVELANRLAIELELDRPPINSVVEIDGEFVWLLTERVFNTSLLPKWQSLDCVNETEEFQFILQTLEQIFDLDLAGVNPAYLTMRKPEFVYLVLNALRMANDYVKSKKVDEDLSGLTDLNEESSVMSIVSSNLSNLSIDSSDESSDSSDLQSRKNETRQKKEVGPDETRKSETSSSLFTEEDSLKLPQNLPDLPKKLTKKLPKKLQKSNPGKELSLPSTARKEFASDELANKLKELKDGKKLIQSLAHQKEQNFALQISFKILDVLKIQEKTKKIKSNLNRMHAYAPGDQSPGIWQSFGQSAHLNLTGRSKTGQIKTGQTRKTTLKKRQPGKASVKKRPGPKKSLDLNELVNKLTGLSSEQISELKDKSDHQKQLVNQVKCDLVEVERRLQNQMIEKIDQENRLLEILQKDLNLDRNLSAIARNRLERKQLRNAKCELRKERVDLKLSADELYRASWSNLKHLEAEQDKELRELSRKEERTVREQIHQARKEIRETETKMREQQNRLLDDYDNLYLSQSMMIRQEIAKQTGGSNGDPVQFNSVSLTRHLERSYVSKLYPKFS